MTNSNLPYVHLPSFNYHTIRAYCAFILAFACMLVKADMDFTYSAADLYRLVQKEQILYKQLKEAQTYLDGFKGILEKYSDETLHKYSADSILKNPILSYKLVKRHVKELQGFDKLYEAFIGKVTELHDTYTKTRSTFTTPSENHFKQAMEAIVRLRQTYNLSVDELSIGKVGELQMEGTLGAEDLAEIGLYAKKNGMITNAKMFLTSALEAYTEVTNDGEMDVADWVRNARLSLSKLLENQATSKRTTHDREDSRVLTEMDELFANDSNYSLDDLSKTFETLCQYHAVKQAPPSKLRCYIDKSSDPVRAISPLKIEVHHENPQVVVIYNFLSDSEIQEIEDATFYKLKRSLTQVFHKGAVDLGAEPSIIRTTSQTWIHDLGHPQFDYLSKRVAGVTGYYLGREDSSQELQIASYRPGGHYSLHTDAMHEELLREYMKPSDIFQGDRVATFMIYLTDLIGGNTAFPMLNISVKPIKGSAILWGNLYPDGKIARNTLHGACPVIYGIKNIATKWILANDQMFTRQNCKPDKSSDHFRLPE